MASTTQTSSDTILYNVICIDCYQVLIPVTNTPLWWKAKQISEKGALGALACTGEECGCKRKPSKHEPDAPFRVFGYSMDCIDFDVPFQTFTSAIRQMRACQRNFDIVFIQGVSRRVEKALEDRPRR